MKAVNLAVLFSCFLLFGCGKAEKTSIKPVAVERKPEFSGQYFQLGDLDQIPNLLSRTEPAYPKNLFAAHISGHCIVGFIVDASGIPTQVQFTKATDTAFIEPSISAMKKWRFQPATKNGKSVPCMMMVPFVFDGEWEEGKAKEENSVPLIP